MARTVSIGAQGFEGIRENDDFYVDKTAFIREWWTSRDSITLVCRPRRFGKTLNLDTVRCFLSTEFAGRGEELFGGLDVWEGGTEAERARMRALQGTVPVVALSFARIKGDNLGDSLAKVRREIRVAVEAHRYLADSPAITAGDRAFLARVADDMPDEVATDALGQLCSMLRRHWGVEPAVLLDEYDTPMQEAWLCGYWDGMASFVRQLFNATFKSNADLGRALVTGITRVASESIFSDMNNPRVVTTMTQAFQTSFGFTEAEVAEALAEFGMAGRLPAVRDWFDGFTFGGVPGVYNPWSITNFLQDRELAPYWANTSSNALASELVRTGGARLKEDFEALLAGGTVDKEVDERVNFRSLHASAGAIWSLLLATGYLRVVRRLTDEAPFRYELALTNREVISEFDLMVDAWFQDGLDSYGEFCEALLRGDLESMNYYLGSVTHACMSSFDGGSKPSDEMAPERFYHGLVLGMLVELRGRYSVESNRESGLGRYDVALVPNDGPGGTDPAIIIEFKVFSERRHGERTLEDTVTNALSQIEERGYATALMERGIEPGRIRRYGFAFRGKEVLVG